MKRRTRDYAKEYARRIERGLAEGRPRSAARGHGTPVKARVVQAGIQINPAGKLEQALKSIKRGATLKAAAREQHIAPERLRRYLNDHATVTRQGRRLVVTDLRAVRFPVFSEGALKDPILDRAEATRASGFLRDVDRFLGSGQRSFIQPYERGGVSDVNGRFIPFETDPNELYRLDAAGELYFPEIYRIISGETPNE